MLIYFLPSFVSIRFPNDSGKNVAKAEILRRLALCTLPGSFSCTGSIMFFFLSFSRFAGMNIRTAYNFVRVETRESKEKGPQLYAVFVGSCTACSLRFYKLLQYSASYWGISLYNYSWRSR